MEPDDVLVAPNTSATLPCLVDNKVLILHLMCKTTTMSMLYILQFTQNQNNNTFTIAVIHINDFYVYF